MGGRGLLIGEVEADSGMLYMKVGIMIIGREYEKTTVIDRSLGDSRIIAGL